MIKFPKLKEREFYFWNLINKNMATVSGEDLVLLDKLVDGNIFKRSLETEEVDFRFGISFYFLGKESFDEVLVPLSKVAKEEYERSEDSTVMACSFAPVIKFYSHTAISFIKSFVFFEKDAEQVAYLLEYLRKVFFAKGIPLEDESDDPGIGIFSDRGFLEEDENLYTRVQRDMFSQGL
jgi:hypothetical protein